MNTSLVSSIGIDVSKASLSFATLRVDHSAVVKSCANDEDGVESLLALPGTPNLRHIFN